MTKQQKAKRSKVMKESWARRKAAKGEKLTQFIVTENAQATPIEIKGGPGLKVGDTVTFDKASEADLSDWHRRQDFEYVQETIRDSQNFVAWDSRMGERLRRSWEIMSRAKNRTL